MSRKAFLIWGLVTISLAVMSYATMMYFSLSKIISGTDGGMIIDGIILSTVAAFGLILYLRFKTVARRRGILLLCLSFYIASSVIGAFLMLGLIMLDIFGAHDRYFNVILEWSKTNDPSLPVSWTVGQRLDYILLSWVPAFCMFNWGLFVLLWFGSLDPRTPSKNGFIRFMKHGFQRTSGGHIKTESGHLIQV